METQNLPPHPQARPPVSDDRASRHPRPRAPLPPACLPRLQSSAPACRLAERTRGATGGGAQRSPDPRRADAGNVQLPSRIGDATSAVSGVHRDTGAAPDSAAAAARPLPPGTLDLSIRRRGAVIELGLAGDLDMATAARLGEAMAWLRFSRGPAATIVIDTSDVDFIAAAGYRALQTALVGPDGLWDPRVALIVGPAVARIEAAISAASTPSARRSEAGRRASSETRAPSGPRGSRTLAR